MMSSRPHRLDPAEFEGKSAHTTNSLKLLERSPEFQQHQAAKDQRDIIELMSVFGFSCCAALYFAGIIQFQRAGYVLPDQLSPTALTLPAFAASWVQLGGWSPAYDDRSNIGQILFAHVATSVTLSVVPLPRSYVSPFGTHAVPACLPFLASGFLLCVPRFTRHWKQRRITAATLLGLFWAPLQLLLTLALWWLAEHAAPHLNGCCHGTLTIPAVRLNLTATMSAIQAAMASVPQPNSVVTMLTQPHEVVPDLCVTLVLHSLVLKVATSLICPLWFRMWAMVTPHAPSTSSLMLLLLNAAATSYAYHTFAASYTILGMGVTVAFVLLAHSLQAKK